MQALGRSRQRASGYREGVLDWDDLRVFLALHRGKTLSAAGGLLRINATTVGRRVTALEELIWFTDKAAFE